MSRDKLKNPLRLEGKAVILEEVQPKYFPYVIEWRNNPELNKFLNQPFKLTMELEQKWYEEKYLPDDTQGFLILIDKETGTPFGTTGWTDMDLVKNQCIAGRLLLGNHNYSDHPAFFEHGFLIADYRYSLVDVEYAHVVNDNAKALNHNKILGYVPNKGEIQYPHELFVRGMHQTEFYRTKEMYLKVRKNIYERLGDALFS